MNILRRNWLASISTPRNEHALQALFTRRYAILALETLLLTFGLWAALTLRLPGDYGQIEVGQPSPISIQADTGITFTSDVQTAERRALAENRPENNMYTADAELLRQQRRALSDLLLTIENIRNDPGMSRGDKLQRIADLPNTSLQFSERIADAILTLNTEDWERLRVRTLAIYDQVLADANYAIEEKTLRQITERSLPYLIDASQLGPTQRDLAQTFVTAFLLTNVTLDEAQTEQQKQQAVNAVEPVQVTVLPGQRIVGRGEIIKQADIEILQATGELPKALSWPTIIGRGLIAVLLALSFMAYLLFFQPQLVQQLRSPLVIIAILVVTLLSARLLLPLMRDRAYIFPFATIALVFAVVFNGQLALASTLLMAIVAGVMDGNTLALMTTILLGGAVAVFTVRGADKLLTFLLAGFGIALVITLTQMAFWLTNVEVNQINQFTDAFLTIVLTGGVNGGLSAILSLGAFNLVGRAAGVVTPIQLMELAHPSRPLLRKLIREAPGTYYHSVSVGNLAEAAAEAVGADALLLRVAAYYHDIGKTVRPYFFTDNQMGRENVHNDLDPQTSAQIIIDHVREGVKMAEAEGLPKPIVDFISTHHGTGLIRHFYQLALQEEDTVNAEDFRYPGPKPRTREEGILMLADSVEATVRSKAQNGKLLPSGDDKGRAVAGGNGAQSINDLVQSIIDARTREGELDETPLTMRDLVRIRQTFVTNLQSIYHPRVDYGPQIVK